MSSSNSHAEALTLQHVECDYIWRWASQVALVVKNLPVQEMSGTQVPSLDREDPLEEGMAAYSSILAWRIPWTEEPGGLQSMRSQRIGH